MEKTLMKVECNQPTKETEKAYGIDLGGPGLTWLPKSQCKIEQHSDKNSCWVTVPAWLGRKYGFLQAIKHGMGSFI